MQDETKLDEYRSKIFTIVGKMDNGSHSANQLQGIDEAIWELFKEYAQSYVSKERVKEHKKVKPNCSCGKRGACHKCAVEYQLPSSEIISN